MSTTLRAGWIALDAMLAAALACTGGESPGPSATAADAGASSGGAGGSGAAKPTTSTGTHHGQGGLAAAGGASGGAGGAEGPGGAGPATSAHVTVLAQDFGLAPAPGIVVAVNDATGAIVTTTQTDATGKAAVVVPPGGLVATYPGGPYARMMFAVVAPPDGATFVAWQGAYQKQGGRALEITGAPAAAATLEVYSCAQLPNANIVKPDPSGTTKVWLTGSCGGDVATVLVIAKDANAQPLAWGAFDGVVAEPGVPPAPWPVVSIVLSNASFGDLHATVTPAPGSPYTFLNTYAGEKAWIRVEPPTAKVIHEGPDPWDWTMPSVGMPVFVRMGYGDDRRSVMRDRRYPAMPSNVTFDGSKIPPAHVSTLSDSREHPAITWDSPFAGDYVRLIIVDGFAFEIIAPAAKTGMFRLPDIPAEAAEYIAMRDQQGYAGTRVDVVDEDAASGYADIALFTKTELVWPDKTESSDMTQ